MSDLSLRFATRPSALARWQTRHIAKALEEAWPGLACSEHVIETQGDRILDKPLPEIGGKGLFTQELEQALLSGELDAAVHSLKDLPVEDTPGLAIGLIPKRASAADVLISAEGLRLDQLPRGARVGTSSLRRQAQILTYRPDLAVRPIRGNVDTRIRKVMEGDFDAIVLAAAGVIRLGLQEHITQELGFDIMLPAPGQGALAVQCRSADLETHKLLTKLEDGLTRAAVTAERTFLSALGGGCSLPVGAFAGREGGGVAMQALVSSADGKKRIWLEGDGSDPVKLAQRLAKEAISRGAEELLHV